MTVCIIVKVEAQQAILGVYVTSVQKDITVRLLHVFPDGAEEILFEKTLDLTPEGPWQDNVTLAKNLPAPELKLTVIDNTGREVLSYTPIVSHPDDIPAPAQAAAPASEVPSVEQLFLTGQHLEQYRHATYNPQEYYEETLRRDPTDVRNSNALGLLLYRRGRFTATLLV